MLLRFNASTLSLNTPHRILHHSLLLLLTLSLLAGTLTAQSDKSEKWTEAETRLTEGLRLYREGSRDSKEQALQKLEQAQKLFHSIKTVTWEALTISIIG